MSGGWQNATGSLAQATTTANNVSASQGERKPLLPDPSADPNVSRRYMFRGLARALPYFLKPTTAASTVSVVSQDVERPAVSISPSQSLTDLQAKVPARQSNVVEDGPREAENGTAEREGSSVSQEEAESVKSPEPRTVSERRPSDATTVVTDEPDPISQLPDKESDMEKLRAVTNEEPALRERITVLENENAKLLAKIALSEESSAKEKSDMIHAHTADLEKYNQKLRVRQEVLDASHHQLEETQRKYDEVVREKANLEEAATKREELLRAKDGQVNSLVAENENLDGELRKLEENVSEKSALIEDMRQQNAALEELKLVFAQEKAEMEAEIVRVKESAEKAVAELVGDYGNKMVEASNKIQGYHDELLSSTQLIAQLRSKLEASQRNVSELSETVSKRSNEIQLHQQKISDLQQANLALEQTIEEDQLWMRSMKEDSAKAQTELRNQHASEINAERRKVKNLQASLETLQHDLMIKENQLAELRGTGEELRQELGKLETRCRKEEQRAEALDGNLAKANSEIHGLKEKAKVSREETAKERTALTNQANQLRRQLDGAQKMLSDRVEQVQRLETTKNELSNSLRRAQTVVNEKDLLIQSLQRKCASLEEMKKGLDGRVKDLEKTLVEVRQTAQVEHAKTVEDHQREMMQATGRIQGLQDELSSFIATAQQLHSSLEISQANTEKAEKVSEDLGREVRDLQQHVSTLQDALHTLEFKNDETNSRLILSERSFKEEKAGILRRHAAETDTQRREAVELEETLRRTLKQKEESLSGVADENIILRGQVATLNQRARKNEDEINATQAALRDVTQRSRISLETLIDEKFKAEEEIERLQSRTEELQKELKDQSEELAKLKETPIRRVGLAVSSVVFGLWQMLGTPSQPASRAE